MGPREFLSIDPLARRLYILGLLAAIAGSLALVVWTLVLASGIAHIVNHEPLANTFAVLLGFLALRVAFRYASAHFLSRSSSLFRSTVRSALITSWIETSTPSPTSSKVDDINGTASATVSRTTLFATGVDALDAYITSFLPARMLAVITPLATFAIIGILDPWTMLILLFAGPMLILLLAVIGNRTRTLAVRRFRELGWLRSFYLDMVRGIPTLRVFGRAEESVSTIEEFSDRFGRSTMDVLRTAFQTSLVIEWATTAATALVAVQVSFRMVDGKISYFASLSVLMLTPEFFAPLRNLAVEYHAGQTGNAALAQFSEIPLPAVLPEAHRAASEQFPCPQAVVSGRICFESVSFSYPGSAQNVLTNLTFSIEPGETLALVGPSGIGKSTVIGLLNGRLQPTEGTITVDGRNLAEFDQKKWLSAITSVQQDPFLFRASVCDNLRLSNPTASQSEIEIALAAAHASRFVDALPQGLATELGEGGVTLSGGQRQRLAIARALLRDATLVLLDEFTAHLDPATETAVVESLRSFLATRTTLLVAHRDATLALADRVIRFDGETLREVNR